LYANLDAKGQAVIAFVSNPGLSAF
jgi:hypothetical protein